MFRTLAIILVLAACSSERHVRDVSYSSSVNQNPGQQIADLERDIQAARARNVDLYAPSWFHSAELSLNDARSIRDANGDLTDIFKEVAEGRAQLNQAERYGATTAELLSDVIKERERALETQRAARGAGAARTADLRDDLADADDEFRSVAKRVEDEKSVESITKEKPALFKRYADLETRSVKKEKLNTAKQTVDQAIREGARSYAPRSLAEAEGVVKTTETLITSTPVAENEIDAKANEALFFANRALRVTREAKQVADKKPEDVVLNFENSVVRLSNEFGAPDRRDHTLEEQVEFLRINAQDLRARDRELAAMQAQQQEKSLAKKPAKGARRPR